MKRIIIAFTVFYLSLGIGCAQQKLDQELMNIRAQALGNERLYAEATLRFAEQFERLSGQKHEFQKYLIDVEGDQWIDEHTKDGVVQASPDDFAAMLAKRDSRRKDLESSQGASSEAVRNFRRMIADKLAFSTLIYEKEVDAQEARDSLSAACDSVIKVIGGVVASAGITIPILVP